MKIAFDLDNTVLTQGTPENQYDDCEYKPAMVTLVNKYYDEGHEIYFFTARHFKYFIKTEKLLKAAGFKYHGLIMNKPSCDIYVDDRGFRWEDGLEQELDKLIRGL